MASTITVNVQSVAKILSNRNLRIPPYQRPYKWERKHIRNLFYDICEADDDEEIDEYSLGSIILHKNNGFLDIVDGQQRLISLSLLFYVLNKDDIYPGAKNLIEAKEYINISRKHARENRDEWEVLCNAIGKEETNRIKDFFADKCRILVITMLSNDLSLAFQLFDSQNNRGKSLDPHDLLKAYHLRAIKKPTEDTISEWEKYVKNETFNLADLFDKHLFRIRRWVQGDTGLIKKKNSNNSELKFSEQFIDDFKGVNPDIGDYPYLKLYKQIKIEDIPISLCMPIIDGQIFFKYIEHAYESFLNRQNYYLEKDKYKKDKYTRNKNLYENMICLFIDRFGENECNEEIKKKIFIWAFFIRRAGRIYDSTMANYAAGGKFQGEEGYQKMFQLLNNSSTPRDFISRINMDNLENYTYDDFVIDLDNDFKDSYE